MKQWRTDIQYYCSGKCNIKNCLRNYQEQYRIDRTIKGLPSTYWEDNCKWYNKEEEQQSIDDKNGEDTI